VASGHILHTFWQRSQRSFPLLDLQHIDLGSVESSSPEQYDLMVDMSHHFYFIEAAGHGFKPSFRSQLVKQFFISLVSEIVVSGPSPFVFRPETYLAYSPALSTS